MNRLKELRKSGLNKHEIYTIACNEGVSKKKAAKYLASYPDPEDLDKLKGHMVFFSLIFIALKILYPVFLSFNLTIDFKSVLQCLSVLILLNVITLWLIWIGSKWGYALFIGLQVGPIMRAIENVQSTDIIVLSSLILLVVYSVYIKWFLYPYQDLGHSTKRQKDGTHVFTDKPNPA